MIHGPYDLAEWRTMLMLREDNRNMKALDEAKHALAIKCNLNCLKLFYQKEAA